MQSSCRGSPVSPDFQMERVAHAKENHTNAKFADHITLKAQVYEH